MSALPGTNAGAAAANSTSGKSGSAAAANAGKSLRDVNVDEFLNLLITELQNQDPLNPMDNSEMVQQIGMIREISATNQLSDTLTGFANTQQLTIASGMIGKEISGLSDDGEEVTGVVDRVTVETDSDESETRKVKVYIGGQTIDVSNIRDIRTA